jgi:hypothetical protein
MEMNRLPIDKGFALLKFRQEPPSKDQLLGWFLPSICCGEQNFIGIAGFWGKASFPATAKILPKKILTSQNS